MGKEKNFAANAVCISDAMPARAKLCDVPVQFLLDFATLCGYKDKPVTYVVEELRRYLDDLWYTYGVGDIDQIVKDFYYHAVCVADYNLWEEIRWCMRHGYTLQQAFDEWDV